MTSFELNEAVRREKNAYHKKWRDANPDKVRAAHKRYWEKKARERMENENVKTEKGI